MRQRVNDDYDDVPDDVPDADDDPFAAPPQLRSVGPDEQVDPTVIYQPQLRIVERWRALGRVRDGQFTPAGSTPRCYEVIASHHWPVRHGDEVFAIPRTTEAPPTGGILTPHSKQRISDLIHQQFREVAPSENLGNGALSLQLNVGPWSSSLLDRRKPGSGRLSGAFWASRPGRDGFRWMGGSTECCTQSPKPPPDTRRGELW